MKRIALVLVFAFLFPIVATAKDSIHLNIGHRDKWIGAGIAVGVVAVLHYKHGLIPRSVAKAAKKVGKAVSGSMK